MTDFMCGYCGHEVGDERTVERWIGNCPKPDCDRITTFLRL